MFRSVAGVQNNSQNKAVVCVRGTGCPGSSKSVQQPDNTVALPERNMSPWEHCPTAAQVRVCIGLAAAASCVFRAAQNQRGDGHRRGSRPDDPQYLSPVPPCPAKTEAGTHLHVSGGSAGAPGMVTDTEV